MQVLLIFYLKNMNKLFHSNKIILLINLPINKKEEVEVVGEEVGLLNYNL